MTTYGQIVNGKRIAYADFSKDVAYKLRMILGDAYKMPEHLCKKLYNKRCSVDDAVSRLILKS